MIDKAIIIKNTLYYMAFLPHQGVYNIYSLDLKRFTKKKLNLPINTIDLFKYKDRLLFCNK